MISHLPADDLALLRLADRRMTVPDQLDRGIVRLRPEHWNSTLLIGNGAMDNSFSARSTAFSCVVPR